MNIDTTALLASVDLLAEIQADTPLKKVATTNGGEWAGPCPGCGGRDRFRVWPTPREGRPGYWCRDCGKKGDALRYRIDFHGDTFPQAVAYYGGDGHALPGHRPTAPRPAARPAPAPDADMPGPAWQAKATAFVAEAQAALWGDTGTKARAYLHGRGLTDETIAAAQLGYCPGDANGGDQRYEPGQPWGLAADKRIWLPRGVVIPATAAGAVWYIKIRRPAADPKYVHVAGGKPSLYLADKAQGKPDAFAAEGEFDALLLWQNVKDTADVFTLGSASGRLGGRWATYLLDTRRFWIATDTDEAGDKAAKEWLALVGAKGQRVLPPGGQGKDITDAWQAGQDLRAWALGCMAPAIVPAVATSQPEPQDTAAQLATLEHDIIAGLAGFHAAHESGDAFMAGHIDTATAALVDQLNSLLGIA